MRNARSWTHRLLPAVLVLLTIAIIPARAEDAPREALQVILEAVNNRSAGSLHAKLTEEFRTVITARQMEALLGYLYRNYGPVRLQRQLAEDGGWQVYRLQGERAPLLVRLAVDDTGAIKGLRFQPSFRERLVEKSLALPEVKSRLAAAVEETLHVHRLPSISLALVKGDRVVWLRAFGYQNVERNVRADPQTVYVTGSIFKVAIATTAMKLVDEGKLDLDAPVQRMLKTFEIPNPFAATTPLTLRHLLSHHSGLPNAGSVVSVWKRELPTPLENLVRERVKVTDEPGQKFLYSNLGYSFVAYLLGQATDSSPDYAIERNLLEPLGMKRTLFDPSPEMLDNLAVPYQASADGEEMIPRSRVRYDTYPAGEVYSTPADIARLLLLHINKGQIDGKRWIASARLEEMARPQFTKTGPLLAGLGWFSRESDSGHKVLEHNGAVPGFVSYMAIEPEQRVGVILFSNKFTIQNALTSSFSDPLRVLGEFALDLLERLDEPGR